MTFRDSRFALALTFGLLLGACSQTPVTSSKVLNLKVEAPPPTLAVKWAKQVDDLSYFSARPASFAAPAHVSASDEIIVSNSKGDVFKFQGANGELRWETALDSPVVTQATSAMGLVFVGDLSGTFTALELNKGTIVWQFSARTSIEGRAVFHEDRVLFTDASETLYALDASNGKELWRHQRKSPESFTIKGSGHPTVVDGEVFCGFADGRLVALEFDTGDVIWEVDLSGDATRLTDVDGQVHVDGDTLYAASFSGGLYAVDRFSGEILWRMPLQSVGDVKLYQNLLYVTSAVGRTYAIDPVDGDMLWSFKFQTASPIAVTPYGPYLLVSTDKGAYILDRASGYPFERTRGTSGYSSAFEFGANRAYMLTNFGKLQAIQLGW